jgi:hypothetical protein
MTEFNSKTQAAAATIDASVPRIETLFHTPNYALPQTLAGGANYKRISPADIQSQTDLKDVLLYAPLNGVAASPPIDHGPYRRTLALAGNATIADTHLMFGCNATYFDGGSDYVSVPQSTDWNFASDFTIDLYARFEDIAAPRILFAFGDNSTNLYYLIANTNGSLNFKQLEANNPTINILTSAGAVAEDTDYHIALVRSGDRYTIYVDGIKQGGDLDATPIRTTNYVDGSKLFRIGYSGSIGHMKGWMSRFRITNAARWLRDFDPLKSYKRYPDEAYFRSADRNMPDGSSNATYGGYWLLDVAEANPMMFGAAGDSTTDDTAAVNACRDYCVAAGKTMMLTAGHQYEGTFLLDQPVTIRGADKTTCGLLMNITREIEGVNIIGSRITLDNFFIDTYIPLPIQNGQGCFGTNITVGKLFYYPNPSKNLGESDHDYGLRIAPPLAHTITIQNMWLKRRKDSAGAHSIACVARCSGVYITDNLCEGYSADNGLQSTFVLTHWGTSTSGHFLMDGNGVMVEPARTPKLKGAFSYHPNNIVVRNNRLRNVGRGYTHSGSYNVIVDGLDIDGVLTGNTSRVVQVAAITSGDEIDMFAHPDDAGKVYSNIVIKNVVGWNIDGRSPNAAGTSVLDWPGAATSKILNVDNSWVQDDPFGWVDFAGLTLVDTIPSAAISISVPGIQMSDPVNAQLWYDVPEEVTLTPTVTAPGVVQVVFSKSTPGNLNLKAGPLAAFLLKKRMETQPNYTGCEFSNWRFYGMGRTTNLLNIRNARAFAKFENIDARGLASAEGLVIGNTIGRLDFRDCIIPGKTELKAVDGASFDNCKFENTDVVSLAVTSTAGFVFGDIVEGTTSHVRGVVKEVVSNTVLRVRLLGVPWKAFQAAETLNGPPGSSTTITDVDAFANNTVLIEGDPVSASLNVNLDAGDTVLHLRHDGFVRDVRIDDKISYSGGVVYATRYADRSEVEYEITPAPASIGASDDVMFTLERASRNIQFRNCEIIGGGRGLEVSKAYGIQVTGGTIRDCGQYGVVVSTRATIDLDGVTFSNNGMNRVQLDSGAATRDVAVEATATLRAEKLFFKDGQWVEYNLSVDSGATGGHLRDSIFVPLEAQGEPQLAHLAISSKQLRLSGNRDSAGKPVYQSGTWVPELQINSSSVGITYSARSGTYTLLEDRVSIDWDITLSSKGSVAGGTTMVGLPFSQDTSESQSVGTTVITDAIGLTGVPLCRVTDSVIGYQQSSATGLASLTNAALTNTTRFRGSAVYRREA